MPKISEALSPLKNRLNLFYVLAFAPIILIEYYSYIAQSNIFGALIPLYGFLLLLIKKDKLSLVPEASKPLRLIGIILMVSSFFIYFVVAYFYPSALFYGAANYTTYIVGLFLAFFQFFALKELFAPAFLIVASTSVFFIGQWLETYLEPLVPMFVQIMVFILNVLRIPAAVHNPTMIVLHTSGASIPLIFEAGCIGIYSFLTYSVIIVVTMMEDSSSIRTRFLWSVAGVIGTFIVNIIRVSLIAVVIYYFGFESWQEIHSKIGYVLFLTWLVFFLVIFSKREAIFSNFQTFWRKVERLVK